MRGSNKDCLTNFKKVFKMIKRSDQGLVIITRSSSRPWTGDARRWLKLAKFVNFGTSKLWRLRHGRSNAVALAKRERLHTVNNEHNNRKLAIWMDPKLSLVNWIAISLSCRFQDQARKLFLGTVSCSEQRRNDIQLSKMLISSGFC